MQQVACALPSDRPRAGAMHAVGADLVDLGGVAGVAGERRGLGVERLPRRASPSIECQHLASSLVSLSHSPCAPPASQVQHHGPRDACRGVAYGSSGGRDAPLKALPLVASSTRASGALGLRGLERPAAARLGRAAAHAHAGGPRRAAATPEAKAARRMWDQEATRRQHSIASCQHGVSKGRDRSERRGETEQRRSGGEERRREDCKKQLSMAWTASGCRVPPLSMSSGCRVPLHSLRVRCGEVGAKEESRVYRDGRASIAGVARAASAME